MYAKGLLKEVSVVHLDVHLWSGRKKLRREDLKRISGDQLPPEDLASLGSKKICDPKEIAIFESLKRRAERACYEVGIRFLGGYAVANDRVQQLVASLNAIQAEFTAEKAAFLARYHQTIDTWAAAHPEWEEVIRGAVTPREIVERQMSFDYQVFRVEPAPLEDESEGVPDAAGGLERKAGGLSDQLFQEVSKQANQLLEQTFRGKRTVTRRTLRPIQAIRDKLDSLAFLDARVSPVVDWIDEALAQVPKYGPIEGRVLMDLEAMVFTLSLPDRVKALGESRLSGSDATESEEENEEEGGKTDGESVETPETLELEEEPEETMTVVTPARPTTEQPWFI